MPNHALCIWVPLLDVANQPDKTSLLLWRRVPDALAWPGLTINPACPAYTYRAAVMAPDMRAKRSLGPALFKRAIAANKPLIPDFPKAAITVPLVHGAARNILIWICRAVVDNDAMYFHSLPLA